MTHMGVNPKQIISFKYFFKFITQRRIWKKLGGKIDANFVILHDYQESGGQTLGHYFNQDLLIASSVFQQNPKRHIDIGSRVDGFVAHVASFREIEVFDIRSIEPTKHNNIKFVQADFMDDNINEKADSVSCLHALEHFGLGRYGDPINPDGFNKGVENICNLVEQGGRLYLSFPISDQDLVYFNAHRTFNPMSIFSHHAIKSKFALERFDYVDDHGTLHIDLEPEDIDSKLEYGCGIYTFCKVK